MNKNKIAGLVLAGAIISGASTGATSSIIRPQTKVKNSTKNEKLLVSGQSIDMDATAVVVNGDNSLILTNEVNGSIVSYLSAGEMLHITAKEGNYYKVKVKETGAIGFISAKNVQLILNGNTSNFVSLNEFGHVINVSSEVHLRGKATLDSNIIGFLKNGDNFKIIGKEGQWYKVDSNGHIGFIFEEYVGTTTNKTLHAVTTEKAKTITTTTISDNTTYHNTSNNNAKKSNASIISKSVENNTENTKEKIATKNSSNNNLKVSATPKENINKVATKKPLGNPDKKINNKQIISKTGNATIVFINSKTGIPVANTSVNIDGKIFLTNSKGEISLIKLKTGQTILNIEANNFNTTTLTMNVESNKTLDVSVKLTPDNGTALLTFINDDHSRAIANINVLIDGASYTTNSKGEVLITNLTPGNHILTVSAKGFNDTTVKVNINSDGKIIGNVSLYPKVKLPIYNNLNVIMPVNNNLNTKETIRKNIKLESSNNLAKINGDKLTTSDTDNINNSSTTNSNDVSKNTSSQKKEKQVINTKNELEKTNGSNNTKAKTTKIEKNSNNNIVSNNQHISDDTNKINTVKPIINNNNNKTNNSIVTKNSDHTENNNTISKASNHTADNNNGKVTGNTSNLNNNKDNKQNTDNNNNNNGKILNHVVDNNNINNNNGSRSINHNTSTTNSKTINHSDKSADDNHNKEVINNQPINNNNNKVINNTHQSKAALQQAIVNYAEQFLGRPYVWGATGPNAFDCSGLTSYVYRHFGYNIGRTTYQQIDDGTPVALNDLQPGDLLFFGNPSAPDHVVMYIGNHQYIQAPQPGQNVDISSWNWGGIVAARRIV